LKKIKLTEFKKILINQTAFIGDVVLTLNLAQQIKKLHPHCILHFLTTPVSHEIPKLLKEIDKVIVFDKRGIYAGLKGIKNFSEILRKEKYDCIISPHRSLRSTLINYFAKPKFSVSFDKSAFSLLYSRRIEYKYNFHEIDRNISLLTCFSEFNQNLPIEVSLNLQFSSEIIAKIDLIIQENINYKNRIIVLAPGSVWETKRWAKENFAELAKMLLKNDFEVLLIGGEADKEICDFIASATGATNLVGKTSISETIYLISKTTLIVTNDSAPIHFAGLSNTPTIAIFGPTIPGFGFAPRTKGSIVIENHNLKCRPCGIHGGKSCPIKTHECMTSISPKLVLEKIKSLNSVLK